MFSQLNELTFPVEGGGGGGAQSRNFINVLLTIAKPRTLSIDPHFYLLDVSLIKYGKWCGSSTGSGVLARGGGTRVV